MWSGIARNLIREMPLQQLARGGCDHILQVEVLQLLFVCFGQVFVVVRVESRHSPQIAETDTSESALLDQNHTKVDELLSNWIRNVAQQVSLAWLSILFRRAHTTPRTQ